MNDIHSNQEIEKKLALALFFGVTIKFVGNGTEKQREKNRLYCVRSKHLRQKPAGESKINKFFFERNKIVSFDMCLHLSLT